MSITTVLVHGVPETAELWDSLRPLLGRDDVVTLRLPGFGSPRPKGFAATKEAYVDWLIGEIEAIGGDIDLVGHDWGGGFTARLVSLRPELVRSWVTDTVSIGDVERNWHDFAKVWQTPGEGEAFWEQEFSKPVEERAARFDASGVPPDKAMRLAGFIDATMAGCILDLYRSAVDVGKEWAPEFHDIAKPGLVLVPSEDALNDGDQAKIIAARAGAEIMTLDGLGHWWMLQEPEKVAPILQSFWARL